MLKKRNITMLYFLFFITFGLYAIYWMVASKNDINSLGAKIPSAWLTIIPFVNIYWVYKYCEGFATYVKKDNNTILWFLFYMFFGIIMPAIVQSEINKVVELQTTSSANPSAGL